MPAAGGLFVVFLLFGVGSVFVLYYLVRREAENTDRMSRDEAHERVSREQDE